MKAAKRMKIVENVTSRRLRTKLTKSRGIVKYDKAIATSEPTWSQRISGLQK